MEEDELRFYGIWGTFLMILGVTFGLWDVTGNGIVAFCFFFIVYGTILALMAMMRPRAPMMYGLGAGLAVFGFVAFFLLGQYISVMLTVAVIFTFVGLGVIGFGLKIGQREGKQ